MLKRTVSGITLTLLFIGMFTLAFNIQPIKAEPKTWTVDDDGPADFSTIQEAISYANDGDTIYVKAGTYYENVVVNKSLSLVAENKSATISGGNVTGWVLRVQADNVSVRGFIVIHPYDRMGIFLSSSSDCEVRGNTIEPGLGTGIIVEGGTNNTIVDNDIASCTSYGIVIKSSRNNVIMRNTMNAHFYSIWLRHSNFNYISQNSFGIHWSIICVSLCQSSNNTIEGNTLYDDGYEFSPHMELVESSNNLIFHNTFLGFSSGVYIDENSTKNVWDDGFPSGGNYWSDYNGTDLYSGPHQNITGSDGIGDTPYFIDENNTDNYPLMNPWGVPFGPEAEFTITPETANVGDSVKLDASTSQPGFDGDDVCNITEYCWDFGDGNTTTSTPIVYHSFSISGIYYVTLTVYAPGATPEIDSTTKKVTITAIPVGGYSIPIKGYTTEKPLTLYLALIAILTASFTIAKRRKKQQN